MVWFLRPRPLVSICMPIYRAEEFIRDTILSALGQTVRDIELVISNDGGHETPALDAFRGCRAVRIYQQRKRLGWVGNSNFVLGRARGRYRMILPHDDQLQPTYLEACLGILESEPECFSVVSDIAHEGGLMTASEVRGHLADRISNVMRNLYNGYVYRALMRWPERDPRRLDLIPNPPTDFCVDSTWILQQACYGELRRVPEALYWKTFLPTSTHAAWARITPVQLRDAWTRHCRQMGAIALAAAPDAAFVSELVQHRLDARRVAEAPHYLKTTFEDTESAERTTIGS